MPNDTSSSPSMEQIDPEIHVPWLDHAKAKRGDFREGPEHQDLSGPALTLDLAIQLAEKGFVRSRTVTRPTPPISDGNSYREQERDDRTRERDEFNLNEVAALRRQFEAALWVGAAHGLEQLLAQIRSDLADEPTVADVQRALCLPTEALPALVADDDPLAERLNLPKTWVKKVHDALKVWDKRLGSAFIAKPWLGNAWNHAWSSAAALTELDRWLNRAGSQVQDEDQGRWDRVITAMLRPRPQARYSTANGTLPCLPTDRDSALKVRLQLSPWLALTLDPEQSSSQPIAQHDLRVLRLNLRGLGDMSNPEKFLSNGLQVGHLYVSVFIQRVSQSISPVAPSPMKPHQITPPAELPPALHDSLDPGEWDMHIMGIAQMKALTAHRARAAGQKVEVGKLLGKSQLRMKTRLVRPMLAPLLSPLRPLPAEMLEWLPPLDPESDSLGSIRLSPQALNIDKPPQYTDFSVLVRLQDCWYVIHPELWDVADEGEDDDSERVALHAYAPLPPALQEAGGWSRLAQAMPHACWVGHFRGLGMLLLAALDLDGETT